MEFSSPGSRVQTIRHDQAGQIRLLSPAISFLSDHLIGETSRSVDDVETRVRFSLPDSWSLLSNGLVIIHYSFCVLLMSSERMGMTATYYKLVLYAGKGAPQ